MDDDKLNLAGKVEAYMYNLAREMNYKPNSAHTLLNNVLEEVSKAFDNISGFLTEEKDKGFYTRKASEIRDLKE